MAILIVTGEAEFDALIEDMRQWSSSRNVLNAFGDPLDTLGKVLRASVQAHVLATTSKRQDARRGRRSLRKAIARATEYNKWQHGDIAGVTVKVDYDEMATGEKGLPKLYEGVGRWVHPVYGHEPIVSQGPHPYFGPGTNNAVRELEKVGEYGIDKIADDLEG